VVDKQDWLAGVDILRRRAAGIRESGAFLLGRQDSETASIEKFVFYDDLDPGCLLYGAIQFDGRKLGLLWNICRELGLKVVADIHVHPGGFMQSSIDRENPMIPNTGHLALILPDYALKGVFPGEIGIYEYCGRKIWRDHSARGKAMMRVK